MSTKKFEDKKIFVSLVDSKKEMLFERFSDSKNISKDGKKEAWIEIHMKLVSLDINLVPPEKDWTYLRDVVWRNLTAAAKKKNDMKKKTGEGKVKLTEVEQSVLNILGVDSPGIQGLEVAETWVSKITFFPSA